MPRKQHLVNLSLEERVGLQKISRSNHHSIREKTRARILLLSDVSCPREQGGSRTDAEIAGQSGCSPLTVSNVRARAAQRGALENIRRGQKQRKARKLGHSLGRSPGIAVSGVDLFGPARRSLAMEPGLVGRALERDAGSRTYWFRDHPQHAQKNTLKSWLEKMWCIPPKEDSRFVAAMEDVLEVYERPYDEQYAVVCLDEAAKQIVGEVREPFSLEPGHPVRFDNEYERRGTCALFMLFEPLVS